MNKFTIALLFITGGLAYGSLASERVYRMTIGYLIENNWIKPPIPKDKNENILGTKPVIIIYSSILIISGLYILWKL